jgi:hypothetical protein
MIMSSLLGTDGDGLLPGKPLSISLLVILVVVSPFHFVRDLEGVEPCLFRIWDFRDILGSARLYDTEKLASHS